MYFIIAFDHLFHVDRRMCVCGVTLVVRDFRLVFLLFDDDDDDDDDAVKKL